MIQSVLKLPENLINEVINANMKCNYGGQDTNNLHGIVGYVSLQGGICTKLFSVLNGNNQVISKSRKGNIV